VDFDAYVPVDQELAMGGMMCMEEMCGVVENGSCVCVCGGGGQGDSCDDDNKVIPRFTEALRAFESVSAFMYAHEITKMDQTNIKTLKGYYSV
jgi:hypothetical protein